MFSRKIAGAVGILALLSNPGWSGMAPFDLVQVDWKSAIAANKTLSGDNLETLRGVRSLAPWLARQKTIADLDPAGNRDLATINALTSLVRPEISSAGSPVLLPFDFGSFGKAVVSSTGAAATEVYFGRLKSLAFHPGAYGYRAYLQFNKTSTVMISGSTILFRLPGNPQLPTPNSCTSMIEEARKGQDADGKFFEYLAKYEKQIGQVKAEYFNEREATVPCVFAKALIEVNILCDAFGDPGCKVKDLAREVFAALSFVGGSPRSKSNPGTNDPIQRLSQEVDDLGKPAAALKSLPKYAAPGELVANSGVKGGSQGSSNTGAYGPILFPTDVTAFAQTVVFRADEHCLDEDNDKGATCEVPSMPVITKAPVGEWRDNFCENRSGNNLPTCPQGSGHAGQDVWGKGWNDRNSPAHPLRAVVDGIAFRRFPTQPAVTISDINGTNIDYIYRHMKPSVLDSHGIFASRPKKVTRGCRLAYVDRLQGSAKDQTTSFGKFKDGAVLYDPTARHLHFEIRVPTKAGYLNVAPYQTLVEAHKASVTKTDTSPASNEPCG